MAGLLDRLRSLVRPAGERRSALTDPYLMQALGIAPPSAAGVTVTENTAMAVSAVFRAVSLISGTLGSMPLRAVSTGTDGRQTHVASVMDHPGSDLYGPMQWTELVLTHLLLHGNAYLLHRHAGAGTMAARIIGLIPAHPQSVNVEWVMPWEPPLPGGRRYRVTMLDGSVQEHDARTLTHIAGPSLDGLAGLSVLSCARLGIGTALAGDRAASTTFRRGAMFAGLVTPEEDLEPDETQALRRRLENEAAGHDHAGSLIVVNRQLKFTPWSMSAVDAQFIQSRQFQIEEIARWFGLPPYELGQTEKQTSWGTGIEAQQRGLSRQTLNPWATRIEQACDAVIPLGAKNQFDFSTIERLEPEREMDMVLRQLDARVITVDEARARLGWGPVPDGATLGPPADTPIGAAA